MTSAVALCTVRPLPVHGHTFTGFDTAQINAAAIVNDAGLLLARIPHRGAKRRFAAVCQFDYRHRLLPGNHFKSAVADGTFGQRRLYHRFNRFRPLAKFVQIDTGLVTVVTVDIRHHHFPQRLVPATLP